MKKLTPDTRKELEDFFQKIVILKSDLDVDSDVYLYYAEIRDAIEMVLDRPVPIGKTFGYTVRKYFP